MSLIRWSITLGLVGNILASSYFGQIAPAWALPEADVVKLLQSIPVFTLADSEGAPLISVGDKNQKVTGIFISKQDADKFFQELQKSKPDLASKVKVQPVSLGEVYRLATANANKPDGLSFAYVPMQNEVSVAKQMLSQSGQQYQGGVPLFDYSTK